MMTSSKSNATSQKRAQKEYWTESIEERIFKMLLSSQHEMAIAPLSSTFMSLCATVN